MTKIALQAPGVMPGMDGRVGVKLFWISGRLVWAELYNFLYCHLCGLCGVVCSCAANPGSDVGSIGLSQSVRHPLVRAP